MSSSEMNSLRVLVAEIMAARIQHCDVRHRLSTRTQQELLARRVAALDNVLGALGGNMARGALRGGEQTEAELAADGEAVDELRALLARD